MVMRARGIQGEGITGEHEPVRNADRILPRFVELQPFAKLHLRRNPFGALPEEDRGRLIVPVLDLGELGEWIQHPRRAVEFLGDCGRGKSAHLHALRHELRLRGTRHPITHLRPAEPARAKLIPEATVVLVDESQMLCAKERRRLFRRPVSFALGTHESHATELAKLGIECRSVDIRSLDLSTLREIVRRRVAWARWGGGEPPGVSDVTLDALHQAYGADLRAIEGALYEIYQARLHEGGDRGEV